MYFRKFCLILLSAFICDTWADIDSSLDVAVKSDVKNVSEEVFHLVRTCGSDNDCHNLGKCVVVGTGGRFCKCKAGTSGDFCEKVNECVDYPLKCGTLDDVSCVFDAQKEMAVCKCRNETKTYVVNKGRCMSPCTYSYDCGQYGSCNHKIGNQKFCACDLGTSGDYCEIIDQCHNKQVDCGENNNATCMLGEKGYTYCKCKDRAKGFDYDKKICKDCAGCGEKAFKGCVYRGGIRKCSCKSPYYPSEKGTCEDCKCGAFSYRCDIENGTKICQCSLGYAQKDGVCQKCDCGLMPGLSKCEFKDGKKVCTCKDGYTLVGPNGPCKQKCNATTPCANGGKCLRNVCSCLKGTSGDLCQTIDECKGWRKCGSVDCLYNVSSQEAYCNCKGSLVFDDYYKSCRECDCGSFTKNCTFVKGEKTCNCYDLYGERNGKCAPCFCSGAQNMHGCKFDDDGNMKCDCLKGYAQFEKKCAECDCGDHGKCSFGKWGSKSCTCDEGYYEDKGVCKAKECDCGDNGRCYLGDDGKKICKCFSGYEEYQGFCKSCSCQYNANCEFDNYGYPKCVCQSGFSMKDKICTPCYCEPGTSCTFTTYGYYGEKKVCDCPKRYADDSGKCHECDCEAPGSNCSFSIGFMKCQCPKGYTEENKGFSFINKICKDIDECKNSYICPLSSTKCVNTPGSYECVCREGYERPDSSDDIQRDGCTDIDECVSYSTPCEDSDATCVNTIGSYRCECKLGYLLRASEEKRNVCGPGARPWRTATIFVGVLSATIIIGLFTAIFKKCNS